MPPEGVLAHLHEHPGAFIQAATSTSLPGAPHDGVDVSEWVGDEEDGDPEDEEGEWTFQPFYT